MSKIPRNITIFGTGLIGGSLALALKQAQPGVRIAGVDKPEILAQALRLHIIDMEGPQPADLIILATPIGEILELLDQISPGDALVTDVGSTKVAICSKASRLGLRFIGGHPMAGTEQSGPEVADPQLFENAPFFLCRIPGTTDDAVLTMQEIVQEIGAIPHLISPEEHDRLVAQISHLPQLISNLLAERTAETKDLAGPGLRSMTRMARSPFHVWRDIFETSGELPRELQAFIQRLQYLLDSIKAGNFDEIEKLFKRGGSD